MNAENETNVPNGNGAVETSPYPSQRVAEHMPTEKVEEVRAREGLPEEEIIQECIIELNGKKLDFSGLWPMTWGFSKQLQRMRLDENKLQSGDPAALDQFLLCLFQRLDKSITQEQIDSLTVDEIKKVTIFFNQRALIDRPF